MYNKPETLRVLIHSYIYVHRYVDTFIESGHDLMTVRVRNYSILNMHVNYYTCPNIRKYAWERYYKGNFVLPNHVHA